MCNLDHVQQICIYLMMERNIFGISFEGTESSESTQLTCLEEGSITQTQTIWWLPGSISLVVNNVSAAVACHTDPSEA